MYVCVLVCVRANVHRMCLIFTLLCRDHPALEPRIKTCTLPGLFHDTSLIFSTVGQGLDIAGVDGLEAAVASMRTTTSAEHARGETDNMCTHRAVFRTMNCDILIMNLNRNDIKLFAGWHPFRFLFLGVIQNNEASCCKNR